MTLIFIMNYKRIDTDKNNFITLEMEIEMKSKHFNCIAEKIN